MIFFLGRGYGFKYAFVYLIYSSLVILSSTLWSLISRAYWPELHKSSLHSYGVSRIVILLHWNATAHIVCKYVFGRPNVKGIASWEWTRSKVNWIWFFVHVAFFIFLPGTAKPFDGEYDIVYLFPWRCCCKLIRYLWILITDLL